MLAAAVRGVFVRWGDQEDRRQAFANHTALSQCRELVSREFGHEASPPGLASGQATDLQLPLIHQLKNCFHFYSERTTLIYVEKWLARRSHGG